MFSETKNKSKVDLEKELKFRQALEEKREKIMREKADQTIKEREKKKGVRVLKQSGILECYDCKQSSLMYRHIGHSYLERAT